MSRAHTMLSRAPPTCRFCDLKSIPVVTLRQSATPPAFYPIYGLQWHIQSQTRSLMRQARRTPSRMRLSPKVALPAAERAPRLRSQREKRGDPFAHLNRTKAPPLVPNRTEKERPQEGRKTETKQTKKFTKAGDAQVDSFKALKMQRALGTVSYGQRSSVKLRIEEVKSFTDFPLLPSIQEAIAAGVFKDLEELTPSPVQKLAVPMLLETDSGKGKRREKEGAKGPKKYLIAAETGSGKTLAYLLPVIDAMKRTEAQRAVKAVEDEEARLLKQKEAEERNVFNISPPKQMSKRNPSQGRPKVVILVPTAELVDQVLSVAKSLCHFAKFRVAGISSQNTATVIRNKLFRGDGIDVVISTPHLLSSIAESAPNILSRVSHLIVDEADSLLDRSFNMTTSLIIAKATPSLNQLIFCSATIPRSMDAFLDKHYPDIERLVTPKLHSVSRRVQLNVVDANQREFHGNKLLACASSIYERGRATMSQNESDPDRVIDHVIVFVNERETADEVAKYLQSKGIMALAFNRDATDRESAWIDSFKSRERQTIATDAAATASEPPPFMQAYAERETKRSLPNTKVLVTTDLGSRGIDTLSCRFVILYDIPHSTVDFIHRLGRVGRMNRRGQAVAIVGKGDRRDVVSEVREAMYKGQALI